MNLMTFQQDFWHDLWAEDGARSAPWRDQPGFTVYRNTVMKGCVDALLALYPAVRRLAGDDWTRAVATDFVRATPPARGELQCYGEKFPAFIASALPPGELAWLPEVAWLDRLWSESHAAADAPLLSAQDLGDFDMTQHPHARLVPHPATRLRRCDDWPAFSLWHAARDPHADANPPHWNSQATLLTRPHGAVEAGEIGDGECALLTHCLHGLPFAQALERTLHDHPVTDLGSALGRLLSRGAFTAIHP